MHITFAFLIFVKIYKNTSPTVWHIGFAFLETWQIPGEAWHLCKSVRNLANTDLPRLSHATATPARDRKTPITAAARWISDRGSAATGQRRSWTTCRSLGELAPLVNPRHFFQRPTVDLPISREQLSSHRMKQLAADLLNVSGDGLPECAKKAHEQTETARVLKTFGSWIHILVNDKSNLQNS